MSTNDATGQESAGTTDAPTTTTADDIATPADLPADATRIGTDGKGSTHYHSRVHTTIYVFDDDELVYSRDDIPAGPTLCGWVDDMADKRGWGSLNLYESFPEAFVAALEEGGA